MEKTTSYLNSKTWYRFIKVIYIFSFFLFLVRFNYQNYINNKESIVDLDKMQIESVENKVKVKFERGQTVVFDNQPSLQDIKEVAQKLNLDKTQYTSYHLNKVNFLIFFLIGNLSILLFFEILKRTFYYIILGTIKPKK